MSRVNKSSLMYVSSFGLLSGTFFLIFSLVFRFLLPFGDEPDFSVVANQLLSADAEDWWSPYSWLAPLLQHLVISSNCFIDAGPMSLWAHIDSVSCSEGVDQVFIRFFLAFVVMMPLLSLLVYRHFLSNYIYKISFKERNRRLDALGLSLLMPGMIYYLGVFSLNQFTLVLSLFVFLFWGRWLIVAGFIIWIALLDFGNSLVVINFIILTFFALLTYKNFGLRTGFLVLLLVAFFSLLVGHQFLTYIEDVSLLSGKATAMLNKYETDPIAEKYPVLLRPFITLMTGVFMTPSGIKVIFTYVLLGWGGLIAAVKIVQKLFWLKKVQSTSKNIFQISFENDVVISLSALTTVLFFVFLFPDYGNSKYYVFLIPFILMPVLSVIPKYTVLTTICLSSISVLLHLALYRL